METEEFLSDSLEKIIQKRIVIPYKNSEKIIDLHTHTNYSDGEYSPQELIRIAIENKISVLGITDHDTTQGINKIDLNDELILKTGIKIIKGIELSAKVKTGQMHILGYNIDEKNTTLNNKMTELKNNSINSVLSIMEQIKRDYNIIFTYDDIVKLINAKHNLGRPDIARLCIKHGYASSVQDAFDKYLTPAYEKCRGTKKGISYEECINLILQSGGIPVLAHPKSLKLDSVEFLKLLKNLISCGLKGIEAYHSTHTKEETKYFEEIAHKYNLLISGGSDYHGPNTKPDIFLGTGKNNNLHIKKLSILNSFK